MKKFLLLLTGILFLLSGYAQHTLVVQLKDSLDNSLLAGASAHLAGSSRSQASDSTGKLIFRNLPAGEVRILFTHIGYDEQTIRFTLPQKESVQQIYLNRSAGKTEEAVIISSSRTNSRIEDLPTKVEVIGSEEVDEEAGTIPGNTTKLVGDVAGIQNQLTSSTTGSNDLRVQGLPGKYTQLLRNGLPLFGGYGGSFSLLQIPPLDLKQVEIIKGASSTLYGGGAIAGMINLVSKTPRLHAPEHSILINRSTLTETNLNTYHSGRNKQFGYSAFAGTTWQRAVDVNKDGYSDVPDVTDFFFHPKCFVYPNDRNTLTLEYDGIYEDRKGGDMQVLRGTKDATHQYIIQNQSLRNTVAASWQYKINKTDELNAHGSLSFYDRQISTATFGMKAGQRSYYTEISYLKKMKRHTLVTGLNVSGERFRQHAPDSSGINPYVHNTVGLFVQDDWLVTPKLTVQSGLRFDWNDHYDPVLLPRLSLLYKFDHHFTTRLGGGLGYKIPSVFSNDIDERELRDHNLLPGILTERSLGANWDINYKGNLGECRVSVNQMFFYTGINRSVIPDRPGTVFNYINATRPLNTKGMETYVSVRYDELDVYLGYTVQDARQLYEPTQPHVPLSPSSKFAAIISNEFSSHLRACLEASFTGKQYVEDGTRKPGFFISSAMVRYDIKKWSLVLNCENIFNYRQSHRENIVYGNPADPSFRDIWAPVDGRVLNFSVRYSW